MFWFWCSALASAGSAERPEAVAGEAAALGLSPRVATLENGLTVVLSEDHRTDTVALHLSYQVGARDERPPSPEHTGEFGCAHLFEHLMFEGSAHVPTNAFDEWLTAAGGWNNAYTARDVTAYHMELPSGAFDLALFLESDRMGFLQAGLVDENLANQIGVVLQERAEYRAEPNGRDWEALTHLSWPEGHPYRHPVIGRVEDIEGFELPAVVRFWEQHYRPSNAILVLVGHFDADEALARVEHWFSDVPSRGPAAPRVSEPAPSGIVGVRGQLTDDVEERTLYLAWETVPVMHPDRPALDLLAAVLSGGRGTRLDDRLYYRNELTSDVGMESWTSDLAGQAIAWVSSPDTPLQELHDRVLREVARVRRRAPRASEVARARRTVLADLLDAVESPVQRAERLADCLRVTGEVDCLPAEWSRYQAVTAADLQRVAQTYLHDAPVTLSVVPEGDDGALPRSAAVEIP